MAEPREVHESTPPSRLTTGEYAALQEEAMAEAKRHAPASRWDLVKSNIAVIGTLCAIVLGFIAFGDRVVARAESKSVEGAQVTSEALKRHVEDSRVVHTEIRDAVRELVVEQKEFRKDMKALYQAMPAKRAQSRLEVEVSEPDEGMVRAPGPPFDGGR